MVQYLETKNIIICIVWVDKTKVVTQKDYLSNWVIKKLGRNQMFPGLCIGDMFDAPIDSLWWSDQEKSVRQVVDTAVRQRHLSENCNLTPKWSLCFPSELTSLCVFYQCGYVHMCMYVHTHVCACLQRSVSGSITLYFILRVGSLIDSAMLSA